MARLEAIKKMLYYPTQDRILSAIADKIRQPHYSGGSLLDPCAGEGFAGAFIAQKLKATPWGVELHEGRADEAHTKFKDLGGACLQGSYHQLSNKMTEKFDLLFLNPPYDNAKDESGNNVRLEKQFLEDCTQFLRKNGLLIFIPPKSVLGEVKHFLNKNFASISAYDYPQPEESQFHQCVIFAYRASQTQYYYSDVLDKPLQVLPLSTPEKEKIHYYGTYAGIDAKEFKLKGINPLEVEPDLKSGAFALQNYKMLCGEEGLEFNKPLCNPRHGHQAQLLVAGALNGANLAGGKILKGSSEKITVIEENEDTNEIIEKQRIVSRLSILDKKTGDLESWRVDQDIPRTMKWFETHGEDLARAIKDVWAPQYNGQVIEEDFKGLSAPGILPGKTKPELLQLQKEAASAVKHRWSKNKACILSGEMGIGKTTIATIATHLAGLDKVIVICPTHLVKKWIREVDIIFGRKGTAMTAKKISEVDEFFNGNDSDIFGWKTEPKFLILSKDTAKLGAKWDHAVSMKTKHYLQEVWNYDTRLYESKCASFTAPSCPKCGETKDILPEHITNLKDMQDSKVQHKCRKCKEPLWSVKNNYEKTIKDKKGVETIQATKRWPLAKYTKDHYARRYSLIIDEAHVASKSNTDQAQAIQDLASGAEKILAMTGTLYSGRASSLFYLLQKIEPSFRKEFAYDDCARFVDMHGLYEKKLKADERTSHYGYKKNKVVSVKEMPGMNPQMIPMLLPYTIFIKLKDLKQELPPYTEEVRLVKHLDHIQAEVENLEREVKKAIKDYPHIVSQYLMACLGYPDRPEQKEEIIARTEDEGEVLVASAKAYPEEFLPKDREVLDIVLEQKKENKQTLVYFSQTKRRDARSRVKKLLEANGLKVVVLDSNVEAEKREEWIRNKVEEGFDVMFTNGKLVETGLDLMFASTIIQYGIEYSIHTLRQSIRRSWRLGQKSPVRVIFLGYKGTLQEKALELISKKMRAAEMVDGDDLGGLSNFDDTSSNFLLELAQDIIKTHQK